VYSNLIPYEITNSVEQTRPGEKNKILVEHNMQPTNDTIIENRIIQEIITSLLQSLRRRGITQHVSKRKLQ
jgi:hypothetical protein